MTGEKTVASDSPEAVARAFVSARKEARPLDTYPGDPPAALDAAYRIQDHALALDPREVAGWKVGRIPEAQIPRFGANRLTGPIFAPSIVSQSGVEPVMPMFDGGFGAAEAEFLLRVGREAPAGMTEFTPHRVRELIDAVHVGIEIASSPFSGINDLGAAVTISDYGNNNGLIIGPEIPDWRSEDFEKWPVELLIDGTLAGSGQASSMPDGVFGAASFLFALLIERGHPLQPGQWISSGAVTGVHEVLPGVRIEARFGAAFQLGCRIGRAEPEVS